MSGHPPASAYEPVIGLEVHAELLTRSKMFCACPVVDTTEAMPNTAVCEVCTGMPGTLPVINAQAVTFALRAALALHCTIEPISLFARKNYFYPDLPKGYQISQYEMPLARHGWLDMDTPSGAKQIRIRRVHLEEDTGKLFHREGWSLVDFNRAGVPLLEIVSEPDLTSIDDIRSYATTLRTLLRYLEITTGDMEKGAVRFEANVSVRPSGSDTLGTRTEIKNLNSFRSMLRAVTFEIDRHSQLLSQGGQVLQETLRWDDGRGEAYPERGKEEADDYRYFPEPDLPPMVIAEAMIEGVAATLPELPDARRARFARDYRLSSYLSGVLTADRKTADYYEAAVHSAPSVSPERIAHWLSGDLFSLLNQEGQAIDTCRVSPLSLAELAALVESGQINQTTGKTILAEVFSTGRAPRQLIDEKGLSQLSDYQAIRQLVDGVLATHPEQVAEYRQGKTAVAQWLFGQVMRAGHGRANPQIVRECLEAALQTPDENPGSL
jgi:aspartyl-tRNA(Asn)/glutamyl-tRNA(Gln) amidotransferase subunit B